MFGSAPTNWSAGRGVVKGPLKGYHHETYVLAMPGETRIVKLREPRERILWIRPQVLSVRRGTAPRTGRPDQPYPRHP
ncbi:hypothetical protein ACRAWF_45300 [Streptomyces sp. L7]